MSSGQGRGRGRGRGKANPKRENVVSNPRPGLSSASEFPSLAAAQSDNRKQLPKGRGKAPNEESRTETPSERAPCLELLQRRNEPNRKWELMTRPGYGKEGRPIRLITNYFKLDIRGVIYHYDVEINSLDMKKKYGKSATSRLQTAAQAAESGVPRLQHELTRGVGKLRRREVFNQFVSSNKLGNFHPVYDGVKNVFTSKPLPWTEKEAFNVELRVEQRSREYEFVIQPVKKDSGTNKIFLEALQNNNEGEAEIIMALNSIMNYREPGSDQIQVGRSFFYLNQTNKIDISEGLEIWFGYHQSIHNTERGAALVINLAAKAFHKAGPVIGYINDVLKRDIRRGDPLKPYEMTKIRDALKGLRVEVTHLSYPRRYTVEGISKMSAKDMKLSGNSGDVTIAKYFEDKYGRLQFPFLHCLFMRSSNNQTYIPFEHCKIMEGQPKLGKLDPFLGAQMIKKTAITPNDRFQAIAKSTHDVKEECGGQMKSYNLLLDLRNLQVNGRILNLPALSYCDRGPVEPDQRGVWNITGKKLFKSPLADSECTWMILDFAECLDSMIDNFLRFFKAAGHKVGLNLNKMSDVRRCGRNVSARQALQGANNSKATFAIIILSRRDRFHSYDEIKFIADYQLQFINQCIDSNVLKRFNDQIATNLCLKINAKLGGVNHILMRRPVVLSKPVMIVGADAVHSPRGAKCPSIAAVVGSMDAYPFKYKIACRVQENPDKNKISQELILEMRAMMVNLLNAFIGNTRGKYPDKIIFFRDGVSEGQFQKTYEFEVSEIEKACLEVINIIVPITYIVVQKRHQTRFKPFNPKEGVGRSGNIPPGTAIDRDIVHPKRFDYFLNSHEGIQGTNKPAHYTVLHDENKFSADELQELSYHLCYTYNKCNRSISIPAPVKYADLACYRAKKYADFHIQNEGASSSSNSSYHLPDHAKEAINTMGEKGRNFFFV